ncbi:MAG: hypothetical protein WAU75_15125 [Solirubrobacteraceae bacterium]
MLAFFDVIVLVVAAPIMLLIGVPASGYAIGAGAWIALRAAGLGIDRVIQRADPQRQIGLRLGYMLGRLFALAIAVIIARNADGRDAGITCLAVVVVGYSMSLVISALTRPRSR